MTMGPYLSITTLNVNGLNAPTKRQRLAEWIQKQDPYICCLQETHFKTRDTYRLKVKGWKKIFHTNGDQKKAGVAILTFYISNAYPLFSFCLAQGHMRIHTHTHTCIISSEIIFLKNQVSVLKILPISLVYVSFSLWVYFGFLFVCFFLLS